MDAGANAAMTTAVTNTQGITPTDTQTKQKRKRTGFRLRPMLFVAMIFTLLPGLFTPVAAAQSQKAKHVTTLVEVAQQTGIDELWAAGLTGAGIDIAVIDTGVAPVAGLANANVVVGPDLSFEGGIDEAAGLDTYGHGTHIAGIIAGRSAGADPQNPQPHDVLGMAPDARIISVKVADNTGAVDVSQVIAGIDWVVQNRNTNGLNIRVLNLSYNSDSVQDPLIDPLSKAVENAWKHGIVVVVSAGNDGRSLKTLGAPATNPYVIAVGSAKEKANGRWKVPSWSPVGRDRQPDLLAPGSLPLLFPAQQRCSSSNDPSSHLIR